MNMSIRDTYCYFHFLSPAIYFLLSIQYHNFTYSSFYHNLKNISEKLKKGNTFNLLSISPYPETKVQNKFDIEKMKRAIEKMKEEEITNQNRKKHPYTERNKDSFSWLQLLLCLLFLSRKRRRCGIPALSSPKKC